MKGSGERGTDCRVQNADCRTLLGPSGKNRRFRIVALVLLSLTLVTCAKSASVSSAPPPGMDISGDYIWRDAFDVNTGCLVQIFWQDDEYHGWVTADGESTVECPWRGYELRNVEFQGGQLRLSVACSRSGCPQATGQGRAGGAEYLLDIVPAFFISGEIMGGSPEWRRTPRWAKMTLVPRGAEPPPFPAPPVCKVQSAKCKVRSSFDLGA